MFGSLKYPCILHVHGRVFVICPGIDIVGQLTESVKSSFLIHQGGFHDLFVCPW